MAEVGILDLEVQVNLKQAESDLDRLSDALKRVREAVGNGIRLSGVSSQISKLCKAIDENINTSTIVMLGQFADQLAKLKGFENTKINIKINNQVSGTVKRIQADMEEVRDLGDSFEYVDRSVASVSSGVGNFTSEVERMNEVMQNTNWTGGFEQFKSMLMEFLRMRSAMALGSGDALPANVDQSWNAMKAGAIEVEGTVTDAFDNINARIEGTNQLLLTAGQTVRSTIENSVDEPVKHVVQDLEYLRRRIMDTSHSNLYGAMLRGEKGEVNEQIALIAAAEKYKTTVAEIKKYVDIVKAQMRGATEQTDAFANSLEHAGNASGAMQTVASSMQNVVGNAANTNMRTYGSELVENLTQNYSEIDLMTMRLNGMKQALADDINANRLDTQQIAERTMRIRDLSDKIEELRQQEEGATDQTKSFTERLKELMMSGKKDFFGNLLSQFARIAKYRVLRSVIRQISEGFREGVQNVYNYSKAIGSTFAPAMDSAASALLQMKNSIGAAAAPLLQSLIPILQTIVNWFITLVNYANQFIALLRGQTSWTRAVSTTETAFGKQEKAAKGAGAAIKDLLADWDELNIIQSQGGGGGGGGTTEAEEALSMFEEVTQFSKKIKDIVDFIKNNFDTIKSVALAIGTALLAWKVGEGIMKVLSLINTLQGGVIMAAIGFTLLSTSGYSIGSSGFNLENIMGSVGGIVASLFGGKWIGAAAAQALGLSASSGALLGAVTGLTFGLALWTYQIHCGIIDSAYGTLTEDIDTIRTNIENNYMTAKAKMSISVTQARISDTQAAEKKVQDAVTTLHETYPVSIKLKTKEDAEGLLSIVNEIVTATNALSDDRKSKIRIPVTTSGQFANPEDVIQFTDQEWDKIKEYVSGLGSDIGKMISDGITEGADLEGLKENLIRMANAVTYGLKSGEFAGNVGLAGYESRSNLQNGLYSKDTVENYIKEFKQFSDEKMREAQSAAVAEQAQFGALLAAAEEMYQQTGSQEDYNDYVRAKELYEAFNVAERSKQLFTEWTAEGTKLFVDDITAALAAAMQNNANYHGRRDILEKQLGQIANTGTLKHISEAFVDQYIDNVKTNMILAISNETGFGEDFIRQLMGDYNMMPTDFFDADYVQKIKESMMSALDRSKLTEQQKQKVMSAFGFDYDEWTSEEQKIIEGMAKEAKENGTNVFTLPEDMEHVPEQLPSAIQEYYDSIGVNPDNVIPKEEILENAKESSEEVKKTFETTWDNIKKWFRENPSGVGSMTNPEEWQNHSYPGANYTPPAQNDLPLANPTDLSLNEQDITAGVAKGTEQANQTQNALLRDIISSIIRLANRPINVSLNAGTGLGRTLARSGQMLEDAGGSFYTLP